MKKSTLSLMALALTSGAALAQTAAAPAAPEPESTLSYNIGVVTEYRYRGISQSSRNPAVQIGADYAHKSGFYIGAWHSTIQWITDNSSYAPAATVKGAGELDIYGGYKGEIAKDFSYDVGGLYYLYAGNNYAKVPGGVNANTFEVYGALTYGQFTAKYSHGLTNLFGNANSKGSGYLEVSGTFDLGTGLSLTPHFGRQTVSHLRMASYSDYSLTLGKDFGNGVSVSAALAGTDADKGFYVTPAGKFTGKNALVLGAKYSF